MSNIVNFFYKISEVLMNTQEIINVLREMHKITGFRISLHGADFEEIAAYPEKSLAFCALVNENKKEHSLCLMR